MLLTNILILNLKHTMNGIIGIKIYDDDFFLDKNDHLKLVGSHINNNFEYLIIQISNTGSLLNFLENKTIMDVFTFKTFIQLCNQTDICLRYSSD